MSSEMKKTEGRYGIGGFLILPILGFIGVIVFTAINLWRAVASFEGLNEIFTASAGPLVVLKIPVAVSLIGGVLVIASAIYCLVLIYTKSKAIKKIATAHYLLLLCLGLSELWSDRVLSEAIPGTAADPEAMKQAIRGVFIATIWIPYFHFSKRVKNTFTK